MKKEKKALLAAIAATVILSGSFSGVSASIKGVDGKITNLQLPSFASIKDPISIASSCDFYICSGTCFSRMRIVLPCSA